MPEKLVLCNLTQNEEQTITCRDKFTHHNNGIYIEFCNYHSQCTHQKVVNLIKRNQNDNRKTN